MNEGKQNNNSSFFGIGWLYRIHLSQGQMFFLAHERKVRFEEEGKSTVCGIIYPANDRGLFEDESKQDG